jgi:hypothetical protein
MIVLAMCSGASNYRLGGQHPHPIELCIEGNQAWRTVAYLMMLKRIDVTS